MFDDRLKLLRANAGKTVKEIAKELWLPYTTYLSYETDAHESPSETLIKIADHYGVTIDYLLGREKPNEMKTFEESVKRLDELSDAFNEALESVQKLSKKLNKLI